MFEITIIITIILSDQDRYNDEDNNQEWILSDALE